VSEHAHEDLQPQLRSVRRDVEPALAQPRLDEGPREVFRARLGEDLNSDRSGGEGSDVQFGHRSLERAQEERLGGGAGLRRRCLERERARGQADGKNQETPAR
jgi:hypothetical protein